jgi:hypothetical protein
MSLYLTIFKENEEIDSVEIGMYSDFDDFRSCIRNSLEKGDHGSNYPILQLHVDSDGEWSYRESEKLKLELIEIKNKLLNMNPIDIDKEWKKEQIKINNITINNADDCFFDVDGENLTNRLIDLCDISIKLQLPILFQ